MHDPETPLEPLLTSDACLPVEVVRQVLVQDRTDIETLMRQLLPLAARRANAPVSQFAVGAVALGLSETGQPGALYLGANLEFPGLPLGTAVHAEQAAVNNAWSHGECGLRAIAVTAAPCGHCRQFLNELATAQTLEILIAPNGPLPNGSYTKHSLGELLPAAFGPKALGIRERLMQPAAHGLYIETDDPLIAQAVAAAEASYAPYTGNRAGVALMNSQGETVCGRVAENAAFNPTLSPMAAALSAMQLRTGKAPFEITDAVLVEVPTLISQHSQAEALLRCVASEDVPLRYVTLAVPTMR